MRPTWRQYLSIYIIAILAILALSLVSCTKPVPITAVWPMVFDSTDGASAHTACDMRGNPIILINATMLRSGKIHPIRWTFVLRHEEKHVEQIHRVVGGCRVAQKMYENDPMYRLDSELEAYCTEYILMVGADVFVDRDSAYRTLMNNIYKMYGSHLSRNEFEARIPCRRSP